MKNALLKFIFFKIILIFYLCMVGGNGASITSLFIKIYFLNKKRLNLKFGRIIVIGKFVNRRKLKYY